MSTIKRIVFDHKGETAGLAAEITQQWFQDMIVGEKVFNKPESPIISAFAVGLGKEIYDEISYGGFDDFDLFATTLGGIVIYLVNKPKKNKLNNKILYAKTDYTFYDTYYELDLYTSYNTRQIKESKKK